MSRIRSKNTKPEILVRKFLHANGFRYRLHVKDLPGKPDIVLPKYKVVVFVNGCFWHGHDNCVKAPLPKSNANWWLKKITSNKSKDLKAITQLRKLKWRVFTLWQCELRNDWEKRLVRFISKKTVAKLK